MNREAILKELAESVLEMDESRTVKAAHDALEAGIDPLEAVSVGLVAGMNRAGELYEQEEYFVPELLLCSDAMYAGLAVLQPHIRRDAGNANHRCVIGVVEGDTHDIGKNLVKIMLEVAGFEIHDLGRNVPPRAFVEKAREVEARLICLSTLMTTTMDGMGAVVEMLREEGVRERFKVLVGGGPVSQGFADRIGADGYAANATEAVKTAKRVCGLS